MNLKIEINLDNAAFEDYFSNELESVLEQVVKAQVDCKTAGMLRDSNGNNVGSFEVVK